jgi:serine O-acetyltransferase
MMPEDSTIDTLPSVGTPPTAEVVRMSVWRQIGEDVRSAHFNRRFTSLRSLHGARRALAVADVVLNSRLLAVVLFRWKRALQRRHVPLVPALLDRLCILGWNVNLGDYTDIGGGLYLPHGNVVVDGLVSIGRNCVIAPWVTIGTNGSVAGPRIGDDVFIGTGAKVLGAITVGNRAKIGANAVVLHDVPEGATVVGVPARVVQRDA